MNKALVQLSSIVAASEERTRKARRAAESLLDARGYHWVGLYDVTPPRLSRLHGLARRRRRFRDFQYLRGSMAPPSARGARSLCRRSAMILAI